MGIEIERKFLVQHTDFLQGLKGTAIAQGYLSTSPEAVVRVRVKGEYGFLTVKGKTTGASRAEFEYQVPLADAQAMLALCQNGRISKTRYRIPAGIHVWEVDVFHDDNTGLVVAEIELNDEQETFEKPHWLGQEVTDDIRYFNSQLSDNPYSRWSHS